VRPGQLAGEFLIGYAIMRIIGERFREPDADVSLIWGMFSRGTFYSFFVFLAGVALIAYVRKTNTEKTPGTGSR
jgi:phosphatidylglycerol:prolipoprotein diacylglycerol transferase